MPRWRPAFRIPDLGSVLRWSLTGAFSLFRPPKNVTPAALFRGLLCTPRPERFLEYRIPGLEQFALSVRAVNRFEFEQAIASNDSVSHLTALSLFANGKRVFASVDSLGEALDSRAARDLGRHVQEALGVISPCYGFSDVKRWEKALTEGAGEPLNSWSAYALGSSFDVDPSGAVHDRPDRFFGLPLGQLVDAQCFAYRAARAFFLSLQTK